MTRIVTVGAAQLDRSRAPRRKCGRSCGACSICCARRRPTAATRRVSRARADDLLPRWHFARQEDIDASSSARDALGGDAAAVRMKRGAWIGFCPGYAELCEAAIAALQYRDPGDQGGRIVGSTAGASAGACSTNHGGAFSTWRSATSRPATRPGVPAFGGILGMHLQPPPLAGDLPRWAAGRKLVLLGYNTPVHNPPALSTIRVSNFHNALVM